VLAAAQERRWDVALLVPHRTDGALLGQHGDPLRLPTFQVRGEEPSTPELVAGMTASLGGVAATPLRVSWPVEDAQSDADDLILIETEPLDGPPPAPFAWRRHGDEAVAGLRPAALARAVRQWLDEQRHGYLPLRPQWSRPGWLAKASKWMTAEVESVGGTLTDPTEIVQLWDPSVVVRATTDAGRFYLKCSADIFASEAAVTAALAAHSPDLLPDVIAVDEQRGWLLMADFGDRTLGDDPPDQWHRALPTYAALQQDWLDRGAQLTELGARDRPLTDLADRVAATADDDLLMAMLEPDLRERWLAAAPTLAECCRRLGSLGPGATLVHGDLHPWNVATDFVGMRFFDWTDAAVSHPFVDLATFIPRCDDPALRGQMWDAYISSWRGHLASAELEEAASLALVVGMLYQLETYRCLVPALMPGNPFGGATVNCLRRSLAWHQSGLDGIPS
jgi:Phosphotransferase enzyme family